MKYLRFCFINRNSHKQEFYFTFGPAVRGPFIQEKILSNGVYSEVQRAEIFVNKYHPTYIPDSFIHTRGQWEPGKDCRVALVPVKPNHTYYLWLDGKDVTSGSMGEILLVSKGNITGFKPEDLQREQNCYIINTDLDTELIAFTEILPVTSIDFSNKVMLFSELSDITQQYTPNTVLKIGAEVDAAIQQVETEIENISVDYNLTLDEESKTPVQLNGTGEDIAPTFNWETGVLSGTRLHEENIPYFCFTGLKNIKCSKIRVAQLYITIPINKNSIHYYISLGWSPNSELDYSVALYAYDENGQNTDTTDLISNLIELYAFCRSLAAQGILPGNSVIELEEQDDISKISIKLIQQDEVKGTFILETKGVVDLFPANLAAYFNSNVYSSTFSLIKTKDFEQVDQENSLIYLKSNKFGLLELTESPAEESMLTIDRPFYSCGDSTTSGAGSTGPGVLHNNSWSTRMRAHLNFKNFNNIAVSGSTVMRHDSSTGFPENRGWLMQQIDRIPAGGNPIVTIMMGTNDNGYAHTIGDFDTIMAKSFDSLQDGQSFTESYRLCIETLKRKCPLASIIIMTPLSSILPSSQTSLERYREVERKFGKLYACPVLEIAYEAGISYYTCQGFNTVDPDQIETATTLMADNLHPNNAGYEAISKYMARYLAGFAVLK